jgi:hypothetical protein
VPFDQDRTGEAENERGSPAGLGFRRGVARGVDDGELLVVSWESEGVDDMQQRTVKSRVWPACSCSSWNGAGRRLELRRAEVCFW